MLTLFLTTCIPFLILAYCIYWYVSVPAGLPPGPVGLPILGSLLQLKFAKNDVAALEKWKNTYGPLFKFYMGRKLVVVLANYDVIEKSLIKQGEAYSGRPIFNALYTQKFHGQRTGFLLQDGEEWKEQRRFALTNLRDLGMGKSRLQHQIIETAEVLLHELELAASSNEPVDLLDTFNKAVGNVICSMAFGRTFEGPEFWHQLKLINFRVSESGVSFLSPVAYFPIMKKLPGLKGRYEAYFRALDTTLNFVQSLIEQITSCRYDDWSKNDIDDNDNESAQNYVHAFLKAQKNNSGKYFTDNQMLASIAQIFAAGSDTTSNTLRYGLYYLAQNPSIQQKIFDEIESKVGIDHKTIAWEDRAKLPYTEACLLEIQRISNLLPLSLMHRTLSDTKINGYHIPNDTLVVPFLGAVLNDPEHFPEPQKFDPDRFLNYDGTVKKISAWIPFSTGKRICLGESLAKMELFIFFTALIMKFRFAFPSNEQCSKIERNLGFLSHAKNYRLILSLRTHQK